ncbi:hypothetical protein FH972_000835 [Carpinus fangiana]|uniref:Cationic amino acid transporter C-terminal domain-containing protein n=1 Tax=Carpinus fangiana TaxID=176857 RepID=A0A5N6QA28_9ROSI|nr:hypothetical protein FH972_000835 [Carpinus fangiana]
MENGVKKRGCTLSKQDFLPDESFQSWGNYVKALGSTKTRLKDRLLTRSLDHLELQDMRARSQHEMKNDAGIFVLTGEAARNDAGPAVVISRTPVAGGSFAYLRVELGDFMAYIAAGNILFEYIVCGASVARSWTSYFATLCNHKPNDFRINVSSLAEGYNHLDPIAIVVSIAIYFGLSKANSANFENFMPYGIHGVLKASTVLFFAYIGFDGVATLGGEIKNPGRDIPIGLISSMLIAVVLYCLLAGTLCLMQPFNQVDADAPFTIAFQAVGMNWAKYIVAFGALKGMTTVLLANIIAQARYFTHIARETSNADQNKLIVFLVLIIGSSICLAAFWAASRNGWFWFVPTTTIWFLSTLRLQLTVKKARKPKMWGVPLLPWLPSACIAINVFIMGSIDGASFVRFSIWTFLLLLYYPFVALHAS